MPANVQVSFAQNSVVTPTMEYPVVLQEMLQFFLKDPVEPVNGFITPLTAPGVGLELYESKIELERDIKYG